MASDQNIKKFYPNKFQPSPDNGDEDLKRFFDEQDKKDAGQKAVPQTTPQGQVNAQIPQPKQGIGISDVLRAMGAANPAFAINPPSSQEAQQIMSAPAQQFYKGGSQIGNGNPIAGVANIIGGVGNAAFAPLNLGLRYTPQVVQDIAGAVPQGVGTLENAGEQGIQWLLDKLGVPRNVQNLGMEPQQAQEAAQAVHGVNQLAAQFLIPALAGKGAGALMNRGVSPYANPDMYGQGTPAPNFPVEPLPDISTGNQAAGFGTIEPPTNSLMPPENLAQQTGLNPNVARGTSSQPTSSIIGNKSKGGLLNAQSVKSSVEEQQPYMPYPGYSAPPAPIEGEPLPINAWATKQGLNISGVKSTIGDNSIAAIKEAYAAYVKDFYNNKAASSNPSVNVVQPEVQGAASPSGTNLGESNAPTERQTEHIPEHQGNGGGGTPTEPSSSGGSANSVRPEENFTETRQNGKITFSDAKGQLGDIDESEWDRITPQGQNQLRDILKKKDEDEVDSPIGQNAAPESQTTPTGQTKGIGVDYRAGDGLQKGVEVTTPDGLGNVVRVNKGNVRVRDAKTGEERAYTPEQLQRTDRKLADENGQALMDSAFKAIEPPEISSPTGTAIPEPKSTLNGDLSYTILPGAKELTEKVGRAFTNRPTFDAIKEAVGNKQAQEFSTNIATDDMVKYGDENFTPQEQAGILYYREAGGNPNLLKTWLDENEHNTKADPAEKKSDRDAIESALNLSPKAQKAASYVGNSYYLWGQAMQDADKLDELQANYANHIWQENTNITSRFSRRYSHGSQRTYTSVHAGRMNGLHPVTDSAFGLLAQYIDDSYKVVANDKFFKSLADTKTPSGEPVINDKFMRSKDGRPYEKSETTGKYIHPDYYKRIEKGVLQRSGMRRSKGGRAVMNIVHSTKAIRFIGGMFHEKNLLEHRASMMGAKALAGMDSFSSAIEKFAGEYDPHDPAVLDAVAHGLPLSTPRSDISGRVEGNFANKDIAQMIDRGVNSLVDGIAKRAGIKDPVELNLMQRQLNMMFGEGLNREIYASYKEILERNTKRYKDKLTPNEIKHLTATQVANTMGTMNLEMIGRSKTAQDVFSMFVLSPQWTEGRGRLIGSAFNKYGAESRTILAKQAGMAAAEALIGAAVTGAAWNISNPFVWTKDGKEYGGRSVPSDVMDIFNEIKDKGWYQGAHQWARYRASGFANMADEAFSGLDIWGRKRNLGQQIYDLIGQATPLIGSAIPGMPGHRPNVTSLEQLTNTMVGITAKNQPSVHPKKTRKHSIK